MLHDNKMDNTHSENGAIGGVISFCSTIFAWLNLVNWQPVMATIASFVAVVTGVFASVHYYYSIKEKKQLINKNKNQ